MSEIQDIFRRLGEASNRSAATPFTVPEVEAEGASRDDLVTVRMAAGRATGVTIDPRAMRLTNVELADLVTEATNAAVQAHNDALAAALQDRQTDFGALREKLDSIGADAQRSMDRYLDTMYEVLQRSARQAQQP